MKTTKNSLRARRAGFSLAELMVVIVIIGLLATLVVPQVVDRLFVANEKKAIADITAIEGALDSYVVENNGRYPDSLESLVEKDDQGRSYLKRDTVPLDPWGNEYGYEPPGGGSVNPRIYTLGAPTPDGRSRKEFEAHLKSLEKAARKAAFFGADYIYVARVG